MTCYRRNKGLNQDAFSFVELVIALAILGLLAAIAKTAVEGVLDRGRLRSTEATIQTMKTGLLQYNIDMGSYPRRLSELERRPTDERGKKWRGPYIEEVRENDAWGNPYVYRLTPGLRNPYEFYSTGSKGFDGTKEDRIGTWN
jgi:type II secretion system protein G